METWTVWLIFGAVLIFGIVKAIKADPPRSNPNLVCRHCNTRGSVTPTLVRRKQGISGGKATGALFTGGISMLATGLSRKQTMTHMYCSHCGTGWDVA